MQLLLRLAWWPRVSAVAHIAAGLLGRRIAGAQGDACCAAFSVWMYVYRALYSKESDKKIGGGI